MLEASHSQIKYILGDQKTLNFFDGGVGSPENNGSISYNLSPRFLVLKTNVAALYSESVLLSASSSPLLVKIALKARKACSMPTLPTGSQTLHPDAKNRLKALTKAKAKLNSSSKNLLNAIGYRVKYPISEMLSMLIDIDELAGVCEKLNDRR